MASVSLSMLVRRLATDITRALGRVDVAELETNQRHLITALKSHLGDARLDVRDYEFAETRAEQVRHARAGRERLASVRKDILQASEHDLFSAVEVAELTAHLDTIVDSLE